MKTTDEMDGLLTPEDVARKYSCFIQCVHCTKWTPVDSRKKDYICQHCNSSKFDTQSIISARTFNPLNKRKIKLKA